MTTPPTILSEQEIDSLVNQAREHEWTTYQHAHAIVAEAVAKLAEGVELEAVAWMIRSGKTGLTTEIAEWEPNIATYDTQCPHLAPHKAYPLYLAPPQPEQSAEPGAVERELYEALKRFRGDGPHWQQTESALAAYEAKRGGAK